MEKPKDIRHRQAQFLGRITHDIKNTLTAVFSAAETIKVSTHLSNDDKILLLNAIQDSCHKTEWDIQRLRRWKIYLEPVSELELTRMDLRPVMTELLQSFSRLAESEDKKLEYVEKTNNKPAYIACDPRYLSIAIGSLLENAIQFSARNQLIRMALMKSHTEYVIEIQDQGKGIQENDLPHVLDAYFSKDSREGYLHQESIGLGLTVAKHIVDLHGGILDIRSKFNRGTVVFLHFPSVT
ncbi:MAG: HAMP domain-containing histidine kinase [Candidatus Aureabacteria bacterium]|nr:HAMP domain-containing histidine kinase [Candidatus Auribacterota bacterium]